MLARCTQIAQDFGTAMPGSPPVEGVVRVSFQYTVVDELKHTFDLRMTAADAAANYDVGLDYNVSLAPA